MPIQLGQVIDERSIEVKKQATGLPQEILDMRPAQVNLQVLAGSIALTRGGVVPASGSGVTKEAYPFLVNFTNLPPMIGIGAGPGDPIVIMRANLEKVRFCLADENVPAFLWAESIGSY